MLIETVISSTFFYQQDFQTQKQFFFLKWCLRFIFIERYETFGLKKNFVGNLFQRGITRLKKLFRRFSLIVSVLFINISLRGSYLKLAFGSLSEVLNARNRLSRYFQKHVTDLYSSIKLIGKILCSIWRPLEESNLLRLKQALTAQLNCFSSEGIRFCDMSFNG